MLLTRKTRVLFDVAEPVLESLDFLLGKPLVAMAADVRCDAIAKHTLGNRRLESTIPNEEHDAVNSLPRNIELLGNHARVAVVLPKGILESVFASEDRLRPLSVGSVTVDPAFHVFRLNHENAKSRDNEMIDLRCRPIVSSQDEIVDPAVNRAIQEQCDPQCRQLLAYPTFEEGKHSASRMPHKFGP